MSFDTIARRWARAIYELGKEAGQLTRLEGDISAFADAFANNAELSDVLSNPLVPEASREAVLVDLATRMGLSDLAKSSLRLLAQKRRLAALPTISRQLARLADSEQNVVRAEVSSANVLGADYLDKLANELTKATGKKVVVTFKQDKSLIGGVVTKIGDRVIDGSVRARLDGFRESLLR